MAAPELTVGQRVWIAERGGTIRYYDSTKFAAGVWVGVELDEPVGKNNGSVQDVRYFECRPSHGIFVRPTQVQTDPPPGAEKKPKRSEAEASPASSPSARKKVVRSDTSNSIVSKASSTASAGSAPAGSPRAASARTKSASRPSLSAKAPGTSGATPKAAGPGSASRAPSSNAGDTSARKTVASASPRKSATAASVSPRKSSTISRAAAPVTSPRKTADPAAAKAAPVTSPRKTADPAAAKASPKSARSTPSEPPSAASTPAETPTTAAAQPPRIFDRALADEAEADAGAVEQKEAEARAKSDAEAEAKANAEQEAKAKAEAEAKEAEAQAKREAEAAKAKQDAETAAAVAAARAAEERRLHRERIEREAADRERKAKREFEDLTKEITQLERQVSAFTEEVPTLKVKREAAESDIKIMSAGASSAKASLTAIAEEPGQLSPSTDEDHSRLLAEVSDLERQHKELEKHTNELERTAMIRRSLKPKSQGHQNPTLARLRNEIEVEEKRRELLELQMEEINIELDEVRDSVADLQDPSLLAPDVQKEWHHEALRTFCDNRRFEMRKLKKQAENLAKKQQEQNFSAGSKLEGLRRVIENISDKNTELSKTAGEKEKVVEEHKALQKAATEEADVHRELETFLREELELQEERERQLEAAVRKLSSERGALKERQAAQAAEVARLQIRLSNLQAQQAAPLGQTATAYSEIDVALATGDWRATAATADSWAFSLPPQLKDDAELGASHATLCGLHRCLRKAYILSSCIHANYIASPQLAVLQAAPMQWLCKACLAGSQVAYAAIGVLGRLHAADVTRYAEWIRLPGLCSCANHESFLDAAIQALLYILEDASHVGMPGRRNETPSGRELQDALAGLDAQRAQLMSLHGSIFKDEPFASWQAAGSAVEAARAACAFVLFASADAGGGRRGRWRDLYTTADRLVRRIAEVGTPDPTHTLLVLEPAVVQPIEQIPDGADPANTDGAASPAPQDQPVCLTQTMLEVLLRQVEALDSASAREPGPDDDEAAKALDWALDHAEHGLRELESALEARVGSSVSAAPTAALPWELARDAVKKQLEVAERDGAASREEVWQKLKDVEEQLESTRQSLVVTRRETVEVEKAFGLARVEAEKCRVAQAAVDRMQKQAQSSIAAADTRRAELQSERSKVGQAKQAAEEMEKACEELKQQIAELEKRLEKHFSSQLPPEDILALRQTCSRQQKEISALQRQRAGAPPAQPRVVAAERRHGEQLRTCWQKLREARSGLLLEQASTALVCLEEPEPEKAPEKQAERLEAISQSAREVRATIGQMLREKANPGLSDSRRDASGGRLAGHDSLAVTRFLRSTAASVRNGPVAKVVLPKTPGSPKPLKGCPPVVSVHANLSELQSVHHALL